MKLKHTIAAAALASSFAMSTHAQEPGLTVETGFLEDAIVLWPDHPERPTPWGRGVDPSTLAEGLRNLKGYRAKKLLDWRREGIAPMTGIEIEEGSVKGLFSAQERLSSEGWPEGWPATPGGSPSQSLPDIGKLPPPSGWNTEDWNRISREAWFIPVMKYGLPAFVTILGYSEARGFCWYDGIYTEGARRDDQECVCGTYAYWFRSCGWENVDA